MGWSGKPSHRLGSGSRCPPESDYKPFRVQGQGAWRDGVAQGFRSWVLVSTGTAFIQDAVDTDFDAP